MSLCKSVNCTCLYGGIQMNAATRAHSCQGPLQGAMHTIKAHCVPCKLMESLALGVRQNPKSYLLLCPNAFIAQWLQIRGMGWTGSCQKKSSAYTIHFHGCAILWMWNSPIQDHMLGEFTNPFKLKSQNSLAEGSVHGVHCLLGNHKRAFPCRSNPINCLPSSCSESVEPDGEECVLSRCSTGNLSALKGAACLRRWRTGSREDLLVETSTFP